MFNVMTPPATSAVGEKEFRQALGHFASGVTVITTRDADGAVHGMTATAFSSLSVRPPLVLVAVARKARCHRHLIAGKRFGVSILHAHQEPVSRHFGGKAGETDARFVPFGSTDVLDEALVQLACVIEDPPISGGDHSIFLGLVTHVRVGSGEPLIHFGGRYRALMAPDDGLP